MIVLDRKFDNCPVERTEENIISPISFVAGNTLVNPNANELLLAPYVFADKNYSFDKMSHFKNFSPYRCEVLLTYIESNIFDIVFSFLHYIYNDKLFNIRSSVIAPYTDNKIDDFMDFDRLRGEIFNDIRGVFYHVINSEIDNNMIGSFSLLYNKIISIIDRFIYNFLLTYFGSDLYEFLYKDCYNSDPYESEISLNKNYQFQFCLSILREIVSNELSGFEKAFMEIYITTINMYNNILSSFDT